MHRRLFLQSSLAVTALGGAAAQGAEALKLRDLYNQDGSFSDIALSLEGQRVTVDGFMAPPLKADARFFVLTKMPMSVCPFCETAAEWPEDILAIYIKRRLKVIPFNVRIETRGILELGEYRDPDTGFVSMVRLTDTSYG